MREPDRTQPALSDLEGAPLSREAYALLAQANLLRMRGCWQEATEKCMQVMTLAPNNASAQSLLGDIYDNQGFIDDAIQWYRMALDVQPDSPADHLKLSRLLEAKARHLPSPPAPPPPPSATPQLPGWQEKLRDSPDALVKWAALGAGVLVILVVVVALIQIRTASRVPEVLVKVPPVVLPTLASPDQASAGNASVSSGTSHDPNETALLAKLQSAEDLTTQGVTVTDVQDDPRAGRLVVTFSISPPTEGVLLRDTILRGALVVAQSAIRNGSADVSVLTLRCVAAPSASASRALLGVVDTTRAFAGSVAGPGALPSDQIAALFTNPWWAPAVSS